MKYQLKNFKQKDTKAINLSFIPVGLLPKKKNFSSLDLKWKVFYQKI